MFSCMQAIAQELRKRLGLTLFNFDLIQPDPADAGMLSCFCCSTLSAAALFIALLPCFFLRL